MQMFTRIINPPPPIPWIALAVINIPMLTLTAASRLPTKNTPDAASKTGLRPQISENLPHDGTEAAFASKYADPIQVYPAFEWKYSLIVGRAVVIIVVSRAARKTDAQSERTIMVVCSFVLVSSGFAEGCEGVASLLVGEGDSGSTVVEPSMLTFELPVVLGRFFEEMDVWSWSSWSWP